MSDASSCTPRGVASQEKPAAADEAQTPVSSEGSSVADVSDDVGAAATAATNEESSDAVAESTAVGADSSTDRPWSSSTAAIYSTPPTPPPQQPQVDRSTTQTTEEEALTAKPAEEEKEVAEDISTTQQAASEDAPPVEEQKQQHNEDDFLQQSLSPLSPTPANDPPIALSSSGPDFPSSSSLLPPNVSTSTASPTLLASNSTLPCSETLIQVSITFPTSPTPTLLPVLITRPYLAHPRAYLGGYRHHLSGRVRLNAETQTERRKGRGEVMKAERETQTMEVQTRGVQCGREVGTQMDKKGEWVGEVEAGERLVIPGVAVASEVVERAREASAVRLQCWLRVCFSRRRMLQLRGEKERREGTEREGSEALKAAREAELQRQIHRRMHPRSKEDFRLLYQELAAWREHEAQRIHSASPTAEEREKAISLLLLREVKLLQTIDRLRLVAGQARSDAVTQARLEAMQSPLEWTTSEGTRVEVVTPHTVRAQELVTLYQGLLLPVKWDGEGGVGDEAAGGVGWEGRVDVLLNVKYVVQEVGGEGVPEMLQLIEREQEWMKRRRGSAGWRADAAMSGLRQRLALLFLHFLQSPAVNPAAALHALTLTRTTKPAMQALLAHPLPPRETSSHAPSTRGTSHTLLGRILP